MPGYDTNRFVNLSNHEKEELICVICQDILKCPVIASCCSQAYCEDCIHDWLRSNSTCPNDRQNLTINNLTRAPRIVSNLLGKLKIKCDFDSFGCAEIVELEKVQDHSINCQYNPNNNKECQICGLDKLINHHCISSLKEAYLTYKLLYEENQSQSHSNQSGSATESNLRSQLLTLREKLRDVEKRFEDERKAHLKWKQRCKSQRNQFGSSDPIRRAENKVSQLTKMFSDNAKIQIGNTNISTPGIPDLLQISPKYPL